jgi:hypothetical protein
MNKVLFLLKRREDYNHVLHSSGLGLSTGLYNSASFVSDMLNNMGIESKMSVVSDNNCIDREVTEYKPTHVIIEALWVVPTKFAILQKLHPDVKWIIRLHSEMPFMVGEGMALDWIPDYMTFKNVYIGINAPRMFREVKQFLEAKYGEGSMRGRVIYMPNYYPQDFKTKKLDKSKEYIDIGCFGAVRPLKNHVPQALAAIEFANRIGKKLRFHVNAGRIEMNGEPVLRNLKSVFEQLHESGHELINHQWTPREEFLELCAQMDIGMQCSFSETFNIVGADLVSQGVPLVGSDEIPWASGWFNAEPTESVQMVDMLIRTYKYSNINLFLNQFNLKNYTDATEVIWKHYLEG